MINQKVEHKKYGIGHVTEHQKKEPLSSSKLIVMFSNNKTKEFLYKAIENGTLMLENEGNEFEQQQINTNIEHSSDDISATLSEDKIDGKDSLIETLDFIIKDPSISKQQKKRLIIHSTSILCALIAAQPLPFADLLILSPIQVVMVTYLNKVNGNPYVKSKISEIIASLLGIVGWGVIAQQVILGAYKTVIPFMGGLTTIPLVYAATFALGIGADLLIESKLKDQEVSNEKLKKLMKEAQTQAKIDTKGLSISDIKIELQNIRKNAIDYKRYVQSIHTFESEYKALTLDHYQLDYDEDVLMLDIQKVFDKKYHAIKARLSSAYGSVEFDNLVIAVLTLIPGELFVEVIEYQIAEFVHDISKRRIGQNLQKYFEYKLTIGSLAFKVDGSKVYVKYLDIDEEQKNVIDKHNLIFALQNHSITELITNQDIRKTLIETIDHACEKIGIISPWINYPVMNMIEQHIIKALKRGVDIQVLYGIGDANEWKSNERSLNTERCITDYSKRFSKIGKFSAKRTNTHMKILVCDDEYYVIGSYNYLSFKGEYDESSRDKRNEIACKITDKADVKDIYDSYFHTK